MRFVGFRFVRSAAVLSLASAAVLLLAATAQATPVAHPIVMSLSNLSANVAATATVTLNTSLGTLMGTANMNGTLSSNPTGNITVDWGDPQWTSSVVANPGDVTIVAANPGTAGGTAGIGVGALGTLNFNLSVPIDHITLTLASTYDSPTTPLDPGSAGSGPWITGDVVDLALSAQLDFNAQGTGIFSFINIGAQDVQVGPQVAASIPLLATLERLGSNPQVGSQVTVPIPSGLSLSLGSLPPSTINTPGCELSTFFCAVNVYDVTVQLTSLDFTNVSGNIVAQQVGTLIPEPATLGLVGGGLAALTVAAGRRRR